MATTSIRWTAINRIITLLTAEPKMTGVLIASGWPGEQIAKTAQLVWVDEIDGEVSMPVMVGGRKERNDNFDIPLQIRVLGFGTVDDTMKRITEIVSVIEDTLADDTSLDGLDGVLGAEITRERMTSAMLTEGPAGFAEVIVSVYTRLL